MLFLAGVFWLMFRQFETSVSAIAGKQFFL